MAELPPLPEFIRARLDGDVAHDPFDYNDAPRQRWSNGGPREGYAQAALDDEVRAVASAMNGTRNDTLNRAAFNLGQLIAGGALDEDEVQERLYAAGEACGLPFAEVKVTMHSGLNSGRTHPRSAPERDGHNGHTFDGERRRDRPREETKEPEPPKLLDVIRASAWEGVPIPPREWLVKDIPAGKVTLLYGDGGTGKSLLALQLACAVVTGTTFFGSDVRQGGALYLSAEDEADEMHRRVASIASGGAFDLSDLDDLLLLDMSADDAVLGVESAKGGRLEETPLLARLEATVAHYKPALLILDNLADIFAGNESSRSLAKAFVKAVERMCKPHGTTPVLLAHPSLSGMASGSGTSGSTGWNNAVRSRLYLVRDGDDARRAGDLDTAATADPDIRILRVMKANRSAIGDELRLRWREGVFEAADKPVAGTTGRHAAAMKAEVVFMHLLRLFASQGRTVSPNKSTSYAPAVFAKHPKREGITNRQFAAAMEALLAEGEIAVETTGPASRQSKILVVATANDGRQDDDEPAF